MQDFARHLFRKFTKRRTMRQLKKKLRERYGSSRYYTPGQVRTATETAGINEKYLPYAYALFLTSESFNALGPEDHPGQDYETLRSDISDIPTEHLPYGHGAASGSSSDGAIHYGGWGGFGGGGTGGGSCDGGGGGGGGGC